ncbi:MAG: hypothetical protein V3V16_11660 [Melioribacteraceae bacterium]
MFDNTSTNFGSTLTIDYQKKQTSEKYFSSLESFTVLFSSVAPLLSVVFLVLIIPIFKEFNSLVNLSAVHQFTNSLMIIWKHLQNY